MFSPNEHPGCLLKTDSLVISQEAVGLSSVRNEQKTPSIVIATPVYVALENETYK
jgi:hypothetical protein